MRAATQGAAQTPWAPPARATWPEGDARPICSLPAAPAELPTTPPGWSGYPQHPHAPQRTGWPSPPHPPSVRSLGPCLVRLSPKLSGSRASTGPIATHLPPGAPVDLSGLTAPNPGQLWGLTAATARGRGPPDPGYEPLHWVPFPSTPIWATLEAQRQVPPCPTKTGPPGPRHSPAPAPRPGTSRCPPNPCVHREAGGLGVSRWQGDHKRGGPKTPASAARPGSSGWPAWQTTVPQTARAKEIRPGREL